MLWRLALICFKHCENQHLAECEKPKLMVTKKKAETAQLYIYFQWLWLSSWHVCNSRLTRVLAVLRLVGKTGAAGLVVVGCGGALQEKQAASLEELGLHRYHFLIFILGTSAHQRGMRRLEEQICFEKQKNSVAMFGNNSADFRRQKQLLRTLGLLMFLRRQWAGVWQAPPTVMWGYFEHCEMRVLGQAIPMLEGKGLCSLPSWRWSLIFGCK